MDIDPSKFCIQRRCASFASDLVGVLNVYQKQRNWFLPTHPFGKAFVLLELFWRLRLRACFPGTRCFKCCGSTVGVSNFCSQVIAKILDCEHLGHSVSIHQWGLSNLFEGRKAAWFFRHALGKLRCCGGWNTLGTLMLSKPFTGIFHHGNTKQHQLDRPPTPH